MSTFRQTNSSKKYLLFPLGNFYFEICSQLRELMANNEPSRFANLQVLYLERITALHVSHMSHNATVVTPLILKRTFDFRFFLFKSPF